MRYFFAELLYLHFKDYWQSDKQPRCLHSETRNILISGECAWYSFLRASTGVKDWAAPAIHYVRALELELNLRLYEFNKRFNYAFCSDHEKRYLSLTDIERAYYHQEKTRGSNEITWEAFRKTIEESRGNFGEFVKTVKDMAKKVRSEEDPSKERSVGDKRNEVAHRKPVSQSTTEGLRDQIIGTPGKDGLLYRFARCLHPLKTKV